MKKLKGATVIKKILLVLVSIAAAAVSLALTGVLLLSVVLSSGNMASGTNSEAVDVAIMDRYDMYMTNQTSSALEGVLAIEKVYWLSDDDQIAPEPDQSKFGSTDDPSSLGWLLEEAQGILDGQDILFTTDVTIGPRTEVLYYLDDTIFVVTWKEAVGNVMYTYSEIKIAHPSQFRRFLAGGTFGSQIQLTTTEMAASVNAVVASSGDFYMFRRHGVIVYDGVVQRCDSTYVDTCFINDEGDLLFSRKGELPDIESAQAFVDANNIRFSVAFGPVLIENGEVNRVNSYLLGEIKDDHARSALCQRGPLHYVLVTSNSQWPCSDTTSFDDFQKHVATLGCDMAYTLDGGQTAVIAMNDQLINNVVYGYQRNISDIIYFATAIPDAE